MTRPVLRPKFNVIVYDETETVNEDITHGPVPAWMTEMMGAEPGSLTWWWQLGGILQSARKLADAVGGATSWDSALQFVIDAVKKEKSESRRDVVVGSVQFWGHGGPGSASMGSRRLDINSLTPGSPLYEKLVAFKDILTPNVSSVWFRSCSNFHGREGKDFAIAYRDFFNNNAVIGHTYDISALQSGTYILEPSETPGWPDDEGYEWSNLYAPHTITALRFYPPAQW